jgi:L,D-transpeptidase ErfK/SrfK
MLAEDIEFLFDWVKMGTEVRVVNQPIKWGVLNHALYIEVHPALTGYKAVGWESQLAKQTSMQRLDRAAHEVNHPSGVPIKIT